MQEWTKDVAIAEAGPSSPKHSSNSAPTKLTAERLAQLSTKWVRVPTDSSKANQPCPICKEAFKKEWFEKEEEWIWRNAMDINGTVSGTCQMRWCIG